MIVRRLGFKIVARRWRSLLRQTAAASFFVALIFTLIALNVAFSATFHRAEEKAQYGAVIITPTEIRFKQPTDEWVWNATQIVLDNGTLTLLRPLRDGFTALAVASALVVFLREVSESYAQAKRDGEQFSEWAGIMHVIGTRREDIFGIFVLEKVFTYTAGFAIGSLLSVYVLIPYVMAKLSGAGGNLFFRELNFAVGGLAGAMFVSLSIAIKFGVQARNVSGKALQRSIRRG